MKKSILMIVGTLLLASCASEDLVTDSAENRQETSSDAIGFQIKTGNMTRGNSLVTVTPNFGVWGVKGSNQDNAFNSIVDADLASGGTAENLVMRDYLVGYFNKTGEDAGGNPDGEGYVPNGGQYFHNDANGAYWYYEGLGTGTGKKYVWKNISSYPSYSEIGSHNSEQFLKYWDKSANYTYFYAYAPYNAIVSLKVDASKPYMDFGTVSNAQTSWNSVTNSVDVTNAAVPNVMYASQCVAKSNYGNTVALSFKRLLSELRLAFYETVPGYKVEVVGLNSTYPTVVFAPTAKDDATPPTYSAANWPTQGDLQVKFNEDPTGTLTGNVTLTPSGTYTTDPLLFSMPSETISEESTTPTYAEQTLTVIGGMTHNFTLNVTLKFTAEDTHEVFYVYGARAYVEGPTWETNKRYIYKFRITTSVSGDTGTPNPGIGYGPNTPGALIPIVFEAVEVEDMTEVSNEYNLN